MSLNKEHYEGTYKAYTEELKKTIKTITKGNFSFFMRKFSGKFEPVLIIGKNHDALLKEATDNKSAFSKDFSILKDKGTFENNKFSTKGNVLSSEDLVKMKIDDLAAIRQDYGDDDAVPGLSGDRTFNDVKKVIATAREKINEIPHNEFKKRLSTAIESTEKAINSKDISGLVKEFHGLQRVLEDGTAYQAVAVFLRDNQTLLSQASNKNDSAKRAYEEALSAFKLGLFTLAMSHLDGVKNTMKNVKDYNYNEVRSDIEPRRVKSLKEKIDKRATLAELYADAKKALLLTIQRMMKNAEPEDIKGLKAMLTHLTKLWDGGLQKALKKVDEAEGDQKLQHKYAESAVLILRRYIDALESDLLREHSGITGEYLLVLKTIYTKVSNKM